MNDTRLLLNNIFSYLKQLNSPLIKLLNDGVDKNYIDAYLKKNRLELPSDVYLLYEWKNGVTYDRNLLMGNICLYTLAIFSSFERAYNCYLEWCEKDNYWTKSMFPIFESGGSGFHLVECNPLSNNYGMIYFYDIGAYEFDTIIGKFDSLKTLLQSVNECYEQGIYFYNEDGMFTVTDYNASFEISKKYNPRCQQYWNLFF